MENYWTMNKLGPTEYDLIGNWVPAELGIRADDTVKRIEWLTTHVLEKVADSPQYGAWETLYGDPADGRFWERTYPMGEMHGGGPPRLKAIAVEQARTKYGADVGHLCK